MQLFNSCYFSSQTISTHHQSQSPSWLPPSHSEEAYRALQSTRGEGGLLRQSELTALLSSCLRSISDNAEEAAQLRASMVAEQKRKFSLKKRFSGFLKKPDMLETVYSVEDPEDAGDVQFQLWNKKNLLFLPRRYRWLMSFSLSLIQILSPFPACWEMSFWIFFMILARLK